MEMSDWREKEAEASDSHVWWVRNGWRMLERGWISSSSRQRTVSKSMASWKASTGGKDSEGDKYVEA